MPVIEYGYKFVVPYIPSSTPQWSSSYPFNSINLTKGYRGEPIKLTFRNDKGKAFDMIVPLCISHPNDMPKYEKPIVLLVNGGTFYAVEDFTVLFKNAGRG